MPRALSDFSPSANQQAMISHYRQCDYDTTVADACQAVGIARQSYYQWLDNPDFCAWWQAEAERYFARELPKVYKALARSASGKASKSNVGSAKDRELFLQRFDKGFLPASRQVQTVEGVEPAEEQARAVLAALGVELDSREQGQQGEQGPPSAPESHQAPTHAVDESSLSFTGHTQKVESQSETLDKEGG